MAGISGWRSASVAFRFALVAGEWDGKVRSPSYLDCCLVGWLFGEDFWLF